MRWILVIGNVATLLAGGTHGEGTAADEYHLQEAVQRGFRVNIRVGVLAGGQHDGIADDDGERLVLM